MALPRRFIRSLACLFAAAVGAGGADAGAAERQAYIASADNPANWLGGGVPALDGVAGISLGGAGLCSGSLLAGGQYVLTAAHCVTDDNTGAQDVFSFGIEFKAGTPGAVSRSASAVYIAPGWQGFNTSGGNGSDLAILKLNAPVTSIAGYQLSGTNDVGQTALLAGYGRIGDGQSGGTGSFNVLHYGYNVLDSTDYALDQALRKAGYANVMDPPYVKLGETYIFDFDNGSTNQNALQRLFGLTSVSINSDLGLGNSEAMTAPGDSGGPALVLQGGQYVVTAVHSYGSTICTSVANHGVSNSLANCVLNPTIDATFGSLGGSTAVYAMLPWINSVVAVPEPGTWVLMTLGLLGVVGGAGARSRRASAWAR